MPVIVSLLRGVNVGGHNKIKMEALRGLYETLGLKEVATFIQSGNVIFRAEEKALAGLAQRIESAIEADFGFRPSVVLRTHAEWKEVIANNPFAKREGMDPAKLVVNFLATDPGQEAWKRLLAIETDPEEVRAGGRELYIYFPNGQGKSKLPVGRMDKALGVATTGRNWNSVLRLGEMAEGAAR